MVYQDLAGGFRAEEIVDAAKQDVQSRNIAKAILETTGCAQRVFLDVGEQRQAQRGRAEWLCVAARFKSHRLAPAVRDPYLPVLGGGPRPCMDKSKRGKNE